MPSEGCLPLGECDVSTSVLLMLKKSKMLLGVGLEPRYFVSLSSGQARSGTVPRAETGIPLNKFSEYPCSYFLNPGLAAVHLRYTLRLANTDASALGVPPLWSELYGM